MDALTGLGGLFLETIVTPFEVVSDFVFYLGLYGPVGPILWGFGDRASFQLQMEAINLKDKEIALNLKKLIQEDSGIVTVAASIIAQVAITALSLDSLNQTHWTARGSFTLSLVSAVMAVYVASTGYRMLCRCVSTEDIRGWTKGSLSPNSLDTYAKWWVKIFSSRNPLHEDIEVPSVSSVITVSAPFGLLVVALLSFLVGFGIWLGFLWTRDLNPDSTQGDSRAVFITYAVGLGTWYLVYNVSHRPTGSRKSMFRWISDLNKAMMEERQESWAHQPTVATSQHKPSHEELSNALRQTARLTRELAESQELLAGLLQASMGA
ncbi:hypothetical protein EV127DRAFT_489500 [Xylaria flabelliformis]|nr:hypothetical protein EV127DRAFT_489500 [Xylaria flabelliformis]